MRNSTAGKIWIFTAYGAVLTAFFLVSFYPHYRAWGFNWWAYLPVAVRLGLLMMGILAALAATRIISRISHDRPQTGEVVPSGKSYWLFTSITALLYIVSFVVFRTTTHFLGDGYQLLSRLAEQLPSVKVWDQGATLIHQGLYDLLTGDPESRALLTYQLSSIAAGVGFLVAVGWLSRRLFDNNIRRYLFFLGLASSGYMLLFFGYVENYSLFIMMTTLYTLVALLVVKSELSRWWLLPPFILTLFLHLFGLTLLPSLVYLLIRDTPIGRSLAKTSLITKLVLSTALVIIFVLVYRYLYAHYFFFTFALLPMTPDRFTVDNDWLFSLKHLVDFGNLLILMVPGLPLFIVTLVLLPADRWFHRTEYRFLIVLLLSTLGAVFIFNPGIGMPRNWDLFSIAGVPLAVLCYYYLLDHRRSDGSGSLPAWLAISLGLLCLAPRVDTQVQPELAIAHLKTYLELDRTRNRAAWSLLIDYYNESGDTAAADSLDEARSTVFPEVAYNNHAFELFSRGEYVEAARQAQRAIEMNPLMYDGYFNLGCSVLRQGMVDSALEMFNVAHGLNPYHAGTLALRGTSHMLKGDYRRAEQDFLAAYDIDHTEKNALMGLVWAYMRLYDFDRSLVYLTELYRLHDESYYYFRETADTYLREHAYKQAAQAYEFAIARGLDPSYVDQQRAKYPQLNQ